MIVRWSVDLNDDTFVDAGANSGYGAAWDAAMRALPIPVSHMNDDEYACYCHTPVNPTIVEFREYTVTLTPVTADMAAVQ